MELFLIPTRSSRTGRLIFRHFVIMYAYLIVKGRDYHESFIWRLTSFILEKTMDITIPSTFCSTYKWDYLMAYGTNEEFFMQEVVFEEQFWKPILQKVTSFFDGLKLYFPKLNIVYSQQTCSRLDTFLWVGL